MPIETVEAVAWTCRGCNATRTKPEKRLPRGWKRLAEEPFCETCWRKRYLLRAIAIPVASPLDQDWDQLRAALRAMWRLTTQASNWMVTELFTRDVKRQPGDEKMPPMARQYLYPEARQRFPDLPSQSVAALEQAVQAKYRAARYQTVWTCERSLPTFRYPVPFAIPNQGWSAVVEEERPVVSVRIGEERIRLQLKGGRRFYRQRKAFDAIASGRAVQGELAIYERGRDVMVKMVAWFERPEAKAVVAEQVLSVRTAEEELLIALDAKADRLWKYNGDHLRRWNAEHRQQLQRWSEDVKYEQRPVPAFAERREQAAAKYHRRMATAVQEIAAQLVGYAVRRKFAVLRYDDAVQTFAELPWFALRERIRTKCDEVHIRFEHASGEVKEKVAEPLADQDNQ
jgi:hypothetical protein